MSRGEGPGTGAHETVGSGALGTCLAGVSVVWMGLWALGLVGAREGRATEKGRIRFLRQMGRFSWR